MEKGSIQKNLEEEAAEKARLAEIERLKKEEAAKILKKEKVPIHGDGSYIRNWIHVEDNIDAMFKVLDYGKENNVYHIASDEEYSVNEIVSIICEQLSVAFDDVADYSTNRSGADLRYALDYKKLKDLGWKQKKDLQGTISQIINFYFEKNI